MTVLLSGTYLPNSVFRSPSNISWADGRGYPQVGSVVHPRSIRLRVRNEPTAVVLCRLGVRQVLLASRYYTETANGYHWKQEGLREGGARSGH